MQLPLKLPLLLLLRPQQQGKAAAVGQDSQQVVKVVKVLQVVVVQIVVVVVVSLE